MKIDVCIIGVGGIGKFHLQSAVDTGFSAVGVDPNTESIGDAIILKRFQEVLDYEVKLFFISTNAKLHYPYLEQINKFFPDSFIIIEKPLFSSKKEYLSFEKIQNSHRNHIYVNLPFLYSDNFFLSQISKLGKLVSYKATGGNWGLACNILHDISILTRIKGHVFFPKEIRTSIQNVIKSKRDGYLDVLGKIQFQFDDVEVELITNDGPNKKRIEICFERGELTLDFQTLKLHTFTSELPLNIPRASEESGRLINRILNNENLDLIFAEKYVSISSILYENIAKAAGLNINETYPFS